METRNAPKPLWKTSLLSLRKALVAADYTDDAITDIVCAVNAHEGSVKAMRKAVEDLNSAMRAARAVAPSFGIPIENAIVVLEQAIAKAEGK